MSVSVCVCVRLSACLSVRHHIFGTTRPILADFYACCLWPRLRSIGLGCKLCAVIPVAGQRTRGTTFRALKVSSQEVATAGAESAVYDCLV